MKLQKILRTINKLITGNGISLRYTLWKIENRKINRDVDVLFPDGLISINSNSKAEISDFGEKNNAKFVTYALDLISKYSLIDGDVFLGRDSNYILFRSGSINLKTDTLTIDSNEINIDCNEININVTNSVTINNVALTFVGDKMLVNGKEVAVVGGDVNPSTNKISVSGQ